MKRIYSFLALISEISEPSVKPLLTCSGLGFSQGSNILLDTKCYISGLTGLAVVWWQAGETSWDHIQSVLLGWTDVGGQTQLQACVEVYFWPLRDYDSGREVVQESYQGPGSSMQQLGCPRIVVAAVSESFLCAGNFTYIIYNLKTEFPQMWSIWRNSMVQEERTSSGVKQVWETKCTISTPPKKLHYQGL